MLLLPIHGVYLAVRRSHCRHFGRYHDEAHEETSMLQDDNQIGSQTRLSTTIAAGSIT